MAPGRHSDGGSLYLAIDGEGATMRRRWLYLFHWKGKRREMGLGGFPAVSLADARRLAPTVLVGKITRGEIKLPLVRMDTGQKAARGIHLNDLAAWIDARREAAVKELRQVTE